MNMLIIGSKGQLATEIINCLHAGKTSIEELDKAIIDSTYTAVDVDELDITKLSELDEFISKKDFDVIINCAAYTDVDGCEEKVDIAYCVNALGARNLAICCQKYDVKLLHLSTDYVFSGESNNPYSEYDICNPKSVYGKTKLLGEQYVRDFCNKYYIIRTSWLYSYYGKNFVKTMQNVGSKKKQINVVADQIGSPTNASELVHHILKVIQTNEYGVYHCTGKGTCSWFEFAQKIMEFSKVDCEVKPCTTDEFPQIAPRPKFSVLNNLMLKNTIGDSMLDWDLSLKEFILNKNRGNDVKF